MNTTWHRNTSLLLLELTLERMLNPGSEELKGTMRKTTQPLPSAARRVKVLEEELGSVGIGKPAGLPCERTEIVDRGLTPGVGSA